MKMQALFFLMLLACMCPSLAQGTYESCCLRYVPKVKGAIKKRVVSYRVQESENVCNIPAIVFKLKRGKTFCADPKQQWVINLMKKTTKEQITY